MAEQASATTAIPSAPEPSAGAAPAKPAGLIWGLTRGNLIGLAAVVFAVQLPFVIYLLRGAAPVTSAVPYTDDFNRPELGENYWTTGGDWGIDNGVVHSPGVKNNPLWLKAKLPEDVAVEFDARSESTDGDIKCEIFGNGYDHASGYVVIFGGWSNSTSIIARLDEHGPTVGQPKGKYDRVEAKGFKVEKGKTYRFRIERKGNLLRWFVDNKLALQYDDPNPLKGSGHDRFGFSSWDSDLYFDNLSVQPL